MLEKSSISDWLVVLFAMIISLVGVEVAADDVEDELEDED